LHCSLSEAGKSPRGRAGPLEVNPRREHHTLTIREVAMKVGARAFKRVVIPLAAGGLMLTAVSTALTSPTQAAEAEMKVDVTITDQGYTVKGHTTPGALTAIVVRNQGSMTHGISSPLFKAGVVKKEGAGVEIRGEKGKGFRAYHLEPGQTMTLYFQKAAHSDPATGISETMQVPFWCDIHQHMKGEFLIVETKGEVGGG